MGRPCTRNSSDFVILLQLSKPTPHQPAMDDLFTKERERRREMARNPATRACFGLLNILRMVSNGGRCDIKLFLEHSERMARVHGVTGKDREKLSWFVENVVTAYMGKMNVCHDRQTAHVGCGECYGCKIAYKRLADCEEDELVEDNPWSDEANIWSNLPQ